MRKMISLLLVICMVLCLLPVMAAATDSALVSFGTAAIADGQYVYFGGNKWVVLDADADNTGAEGIFLLSADVVQTGIAFDDSGLNNVWAESDARTWAAEYAASFSETEQAAIKTVSKTDAAEGNWIASNLENEQVFFLSAQEVDTYLTHDAAAGNGWWLRSGYTENGEAIYAGVVSDVGEMGTPHVAAQYDARPAVNLDSKKITMVKSVDEASGKLCLLDDSRSFTASVDATTMLLGYTDWTVNVTYSGAKAGSNEYVTALICDAEGNVIHTADVAVNSESGTAAVAIPQGLAGEYTMYVYSEQRNGGNATDYTSALVPIPLTVEDGIREWNLTLGDDITLKFYVDIEDPDAVMEITVGDQITRKKASEVQTDANGDYIFAVDLAAAQMTEQVKLQLSVGDSKGALHTYSVRAYADSLLADESKSDCHAIVKEMLNYGGKAQQYFQYKTDALANDGINVHTAQVPTETTGLSVFGSVEGVGFYGATMVFDARTAVRYYFTVNTNADDYTFTVNGTDYKPVEKGGKYYIEVSGIAPQNLDKPISVQVNGTLTVTYSPMNYMVRMSAKGSDSLKALLAALYGYHQAAKTYTA